MWNLAGVASPLETARPMYFGKGISGPQHGDHPTLQSSQLDAVIRIGPALSYGLSLRSHFAGPLRGPAGRHALVHLPLEYHDVVMRLRHDVVDLALRGGVGRDGLLGHGLARSPLDRGETVVEARMFASEDLRLPLTLLPFVARQAL